jgi:hypothetical protein
MANLQNRDPDNRDGNVNEHGHVHPTSNEIPGNPVSYRDGYVHGRVSEQRLLEEELEVRDNDNAARGLIMGIILATLVGLGLAALFFWNRQQEAPIPVVVPIPSASPTPAASQQPNRTTVIERQVEQRVPVVVPQQQAPDIKVIAPQQQAPAPSPAQQSAPAQNTIINVTPPAPTQTGSGTSGNSTNSTDGNSPNSGTQGQTGSPSTSGTDSSP